jgi:hypothetical protein
MRGSDESLVKSAPVSEAASESEVNAAVAVAGEYLFAGEEGPTLAVLLSHKAGPSAAS